MRYWCDLIMHFLLSNSRHGTHSPFVYKMADKVIYNSTAIPCTKAKSYELLINRLQTFLKDEMGEEALVCSVDGVSLDTVISLHQKYSSIILKDIYITKQNKRNWNLIQQDPNVLVTIDLFYFGILIDRKEQRKENFKLRFPFGKY